jgi:hypothetical protein
MTETNVAGPGASAEPTQRVPSADALARRGPGSGAPPLIRARRLT